MTTNESLAETQQPGVRLQGRAGLRAAGAACLRGAAFVASVLCVYAAGRGALVFAQVASFEIAARDGRLLPERLEVPAGVKLRLTLRNEGKTPVEFENLELRIEKVVAPDSASSVTVQPLKPGNYPVIDDFHSDTGKMLIIAK